MINKDILPHFIDETIYVIDEKIINTPISKDTTIESDVGLIKNSDSQKQTVDNNITTLHDLMIVIYDKENNLLDETSKELLENILTAVKYNIKEAHIINLAKLDTPKEYFLIHSGKRTILFCEEAKHLFDQAIDKYNVTNLDQKSFLYSDDLPTLNSDVTKKKLLWSSLKELFI